MQKTKRILLSVLLIAGITCFLGCNALDKGYDKVPVYHEATPTTPAHYTTNLVDKPLVTGTTGVVGSLPVPFASLIATAFGGLYALYRNIRNKQALLSVIQGVEAFRKTLQTPELQATDAKLKDFLIEHQEIAGTLSTVSTLVNAYTADTVPKKS